MFVLHNLVVLVLPLCISSEKIQENIGNDIGGRNNHLTERLDSLELQLASQNEQNKKNAAHMEHQELEITTQKQLIQKQTAKIENLQKEINKLQFQCENAVENHSNPKSGSFLGNPKELANKRRLSRFILDDIADTRVAFTAYLDHNIEHLGINQIIVFNKVLFNDGGMYNNGSGIFTCPVDGVYLFFFEISCFDGEQIVAKLVVNGVNEIDGIADTEGTTQEAQGSNMAILHLMKGTHVSVENYRWGEKKAKGNPTNRFNTFNGLLLYQ